MSSSDNQNSKPSYPIEVPLLCMARARQAKVRRPNKISARGKWGGKLRLCPAAYAFHLLFFLFPSPSPSSADDTSFCSTPRNVSITSLQAARIAKVSCVARADRFHQPPPPGRIPDSRVVATHSRAHFLFTQPARQLHRHHHSLAPSHSSPRRRIIQLPPATNTPPSPPCLPRRTSSDYSDEELNTNEGADPIHNGQKGADADDANGGVDKKGSYVGIHSTGFRDFLLKARAASRHRRLRFRTSLGGLVLTF